MDPQPTPQEECRDADEIMNQLRRDVPEVVRELVASCGDAACYDHVDPAPVPSREKVKQIIELGRQVLFPGYFHPEVVDQVNLEYRLGQDVTRLFELCADQISWAVRHDCIRQNRSCTHCHTLGRATALEFVRRLPGLRQVLASDVRAALEGDPAAAGPDEVIFSYPGLYATTVYRMAHRLNHLGVPLIPRMMTEYAHAHTGIDIHPGAHIEPSFFIDHGTGVVVGQTARIGRGVRIYQGVTLGALSLPRDAGQRLQGAQRHPTIEDNVIIYSGATILGGDTIVGHDSVVGGNVWLTQSVPPFTKVLLKSPELIYAGGDARAGEAKP